LGHAIVSANGEPRVVAVVQARTGSTRLPAKVLRPIGGRPALELLLERLGRASSLDEIVLAVPEGDADDALVELAERNSVRCTRGSNSDVLSRFVAATHAASADVVVRITGDCPLVDPGVVDAVVQALGAGALDYVRTSHRFPDGFDVEAFTASALELAHERATSQHDREHVTPYLARTADLQRALVEPDADRSAFRVTLDEPEDLQVISAVFEHFGGTAFTYQEVADLMDQRPELFAANQVHGRDEGAQLSTGEKLWRRAKRVIPGGNMLLSKRPEMFLPNGWPAYFSRAAGCTVWDLDERAYTDTGYMGIGTNILGYADPVVDEAVVATIGKGVMSTLNCPEEVLLAERLVALHPWADMARFARSGGEACAIAVRIARAASGRSGVAICGYHGWSDWYLAANLADDDALDGHLLPGLDPKGVPRHLTGSVRPFVYNDLDTLERVLSAGDVGVVFMEVTRSSGPAPGFLEGVRRLASAHDAVLVFDECTSGFRRALGGIHLDYGVDPDVAVFGKTLGNGYAVTAVIGRREVMDIAQETFISSTFWTERIGPTAALAALDRMTETDACARIDEIGRRVLATWEHLGAEAGLALTTSGLPALATFAVDGFDPTLVKTFVTRSMLERGQLSGTALYASIAHDYHVLDRYAEDLAPVFRDLATCASDDELAARLPDGPAQTGFGRLV
jgi:glutamate-1-semialdehyde 2,1-aminomutase